MLLRKLSQSFKITLALMVATFSSGLLQPAVAYANPPEGNVPGNNGTLKTHEKGSTIEDPSTEPKVCVFNFEGFGFDEGQTGLIMIEPQGGDSDTTDTASLMFGPADADGFYATEYLNDGVQTLDDGHYKSTLYGKDSDGGYTEDLKAKSKNFKVDCSPEVVKPAGNLTVNIDCEAGSFSGVVTAPEGGTAVYKVNGNVTAPGSYPNLTPGSYTVEMFVNDVLVDSETVEVLACEDEVMYVNPVAPTVTDDCRTANDGIALPENSDQITYTLNGNVVTATLKNPSTHDFGASLNGYVVAENGLTATYTVTFPNDQPCLTPSVCETPANGGVITQNTAGWTIYGDAEFVKNGLELSSNEWSGSYIKNTASYMISDALKLGWTVEGTIDGASGMAIIFKTASGANIHYEPEPYSDDFWTNTPGILPANAGGQGGPYSGSLQDILDTGGDQAIVGTYFYFNSATENTVALKSLSFNCMTYTFDKEDEVLGDNDKKIDICHATDSVTNPYNKISVSTKAADGIAGNSGGEADHYGEHKGPLASSQAAAQVFKDAHITWGDIIPPIKDMHDGLNWTAQGQAMYNNGDCEYVAPVDSCPLVPGVQTDTALCPPGQGGGQTQGTSTTNTPQTLGASTELPAALPSTGGEQNPMLILLASLMAYGIAYLFQGRRQLNQNRA